MAKAKKFSWSYSSLSMFDNCPKKYYHVRIAKSHSDANKFNTMGDDEHKQIEAYLKSGTPLPAKLDRIKPVLDKLMAQKGLRLIEKPMCIDANFKPCDFRDWDNGWLRGKSDFILVIGTIAIYIDWKTGKFRPADDQLELAALMIFHEMPFITEVRGSLFYIYHDKPHRRVIKVEEAQALWNKFLPTVTKMVMAEANNEFPMTPNGLCGYCPVGSCPHNTNDEAVR